MSLTPEQAKLLLQQMDDIDPDTHDGSYERVKKTVELYKKHDVNTLNKEDVDLVYYMATIPKEKKRNDIDIYSEKIDASNLSDIEKKKLKELIADMEEHKFAKYANTYNNSLTGKKKEKIGMFGQPTATLNIKGHGSSLVKPLFESLFAIYDYSVGKTNDVNRLYLDLENILTSKYVFGGMKKATFSQIAHCVCPTLFPITNTRSYDKIRELGICSPQKGTKDFKEYFELCRKLNDFRNTYCHFKNYRCLDVVAQLMCDDGNISEDFEQFVTINGTNIIKNGVITMNSIDSIIRESLKNNKQVILTGAPGTGKTYSVLEYVNKSEYEFVQFHPTYDYSDFVEGLRPAMLSSSPNSPTFVRIDGIFKKFCRKIVENNLCEACNISNHDSKTMKEEYKKLTNKEEEAIGRLENTKVAEELCDSNRKYFFIIDEINRADLSKVFGELMFGLEESYRGYRFNTQYMNLKTYAINSTDHLAEPIEFDCFEDGFFIPKNLYIIGTMNDIDRSVEAFDFALRRRFEWVEIKANDVFVDGMKGMNEASRKITNIPTGQNPDDVITDLARKVEGMNEVISKDNNIFRLTDAYHIGHAYFKNYDGSEDSLKKIFNTNITSILKEYTRGRNITEVENLLIKPCRDALIN